MKNKIGASIFLIVLVASAIFPSLAQATINSKGNDLPFDPYAFDLPPGTKTMTMDELLSMAEVSEEREFEKVELPISEPAGTFDAPFENMVNMSKEDLYRLQALPGYYTLEQESTPQPVNQQALGQEMLLVDPQPVYAVVIVDEEMWLRVEWLLGHPVPLEYVYNWAYNILEGGDNPLESGFGINIEATIFTFWDDSPDGIGLQELLYIIDDIPPQSVGADIMLLMSGENDNVRDGCAWTPTTGSTRHFVMKSYVSHNQLLFQHECTHLFGPLDHGWDWEPYCIMGWLWDSVTSTYCAACTGNINEHKYRFD